MVSTDNQKSIVPIPRRDPIRKKNGEISYTRRVWISRKAINQANYTCMLERVHTKFAEVLSEAGIYIPLPGF